MGYYVGAVRIILILSPDNSALMPMTPARIWGEIQFSISAQKLIV